MGRKGKKWFGAVKKVFSPECKEKKCCDKSKKKWGFGKSKHADPCTLEPIENGTSDGAAAAEPVTDIATHADEIKLAEAESQQSKHVYSVALATAAAAEAAVAAAQAAAEVVRLTTPTKFAGKSREEVAAIKIQTAFRGYLARRALRALRGLVRLKSLIDGNSVKRQATTTLRCMQTLARVQSQIRSRRIRMSEENQALQRQLLLKRERELEKLRMGEEWDDSLQSKQQIEASLLSKQEAAVRRERALAYAFSHQWKSSSRSANPLFMDPNNPQWGWSWLERWMAARPWESRSTTTEKEPTSDQASIKSASHSVGGEITKAYARRDTISDRPSPRTPKSNHPVGRFSPSTPPSKASSTGGKMKSSTSRGGWGQLEDDSRSILSLQSDRHRRHSLGGSSVRDDESLASSPAVPSYMVPTESARAKSRFQGSSYGVKVETPEKGSIGSAKKRLSFPMVDKQNMLSPSVARRLSGPPKVNAASAKEISVETNGGSS